MQQEIFHFDTFTTTQKGGRTLCLNSTAEILCFCWQHIDTGVLRGLLLHVWHRLFNQRYVVFGSFLLCSHIGSFRQSTGCFFYLGAGRRNLERVQSEWMSGDYPEFRACLKAAVVKYSDEPCLRQYSHEVIIVPSHQPPQSSLQSYHTAVIWTELPSIIRSLQGATKAQKLRCQLYWCVAWLSDRLLRFQPSLQSKWIHLEFECVAQRRENGLQTPWV